MTARMSSALLTASERAAQTASSWSRRIEDIGGLVGLHEELLAGIVVIANDLVGVVPTTRNESAAKPKPSMEVLLAIEDDDD